MILLNNKANQIFSVLENHDHDTSIANLFSSEEFILSVSDGQICVPIGIDSNGKNIICDITKFPHLLIGGAARSGKTSFIQSMLAGIAATYSNNLLKFIIFNSRNDYDVFDGLPNLLIPVITDSQKASRTITWLQNEATNRIKQLADNNCKNIKAYNNEHDTMPYIIVVFDDFADLSVQYGSEKIEKDLWPVLSRGRIVGIHVLIATSLPSTEIITIPLKSSLPSRMSFFVLSKDFSQMILDKNGAEKLSHQGEFILKSSLIYDKGICLYSNEDEIKNLFSTIKHLYKISFEGLEEALINIFNKVKINSYENEDEESTEEDELYREAVALVKQSGKASISYVQRRLNVGYNRAARMIEQMEIDGIVSSSDGSLPREVLIKD